MDASGQRPARAAWAALLAFCLLFSCAWTAPAWAGDDEPPAPPEAAEGGDEAAAEGLEAAALDEQLFDDPLTTGAVVLFRFVPVVVGLLLLILWYLKRDKIRGGLLPAPPPVATTRPFGVSMAIGLTLLAMLVVPLVALLFIGNQLGIRLERLETVPIWGQVLAGALGSIPVALFIVWRRRSLDRPALDPAAAPPPAELQTVDPGTPGSAPPAVARAFGLGGWTVCVAALVVLPVTFAWALVMDGFGIAQETQDLVQRVVEPEAPPYDAWIIAAFGVLVAPFAEESIFRGMLYPAAKRAFGGGRRAMWIAAIVVSLIFAAIHASWFALLPLFALAMVLTWIFETTNSLAAVVFAHALHNLFSLIPLLLLRFLP